MSVDDLHSDEQKFLVAYAADAIFIAFRGTATRKDLAKDLRTDYHYKFGGSFHAGFFKRANDFLHVHDETLPSNRVSELIYASKKRIVFCGHSLGGAVAHMVLLLILLEENWPHDELVSH
jgi:predicted lipase